MRKIDLLMMANRNLWRRKARTILTCLGVVIGTASIVVMLSLGIGMQVSVQESMAQWGSLNIIRIHQGMRYDYESGEPIGEERRLNDAALEEIKSIDGVVAVSPIYQIYGQARLGRLEGHLQIVDLDTSVMEEMEFSVEHGRLPEPHESFVAVAGAQVIQQFYDPRQMQQHMGPVYQEEQDPEKLLEQRVQVTFQNQADYERSQNYNFFIVGILDESNMERAWEVFAPISDIKRIRDFINQGMERQASSREVAVVGGAVIERAGAGQRKRDDRQNDYDSILVKAEDVNKAKIISSQLRDMGYNAWSMADSLEGIEHTYRTLQAILGGIGGVTLFVAALGITNTMIMSIYERTREIGVIKVIGASFADVRLLFLTEAGLIGFFGGVLGLGLSYGISRIINSISAQYIEQGMMGGPSAQISVIPLWLALFAMGFAVLVGLVSGYYPANRAIKLSPIVAIRNE